jgi:energy-coupling factor transporter ATP-binding protein EcfA2
VLQKLKVRNFLALRDVSLDLEPFTVFVGPNASGKSTILETIHRVCAMNSGRHRVLIEGGDFPDRLDSRFVWLSPREVLSKNAEAFLTWVAQFDKREVTIELNGKLSVNDEWSLTIITSDGTVNHAFNYKDNSFDNLKGIINSLPESISLRPNGSRMALPPYSPLKKPVLENDGSGLAAVCVNIQQEQPDIFERIQFSLS